MGVGEGVLTDGARGRREGLFDDIVLIDGLEVIVGDTLGGGLFVGLFIGDFVGLFVVQR